MIAPRWLSTPTQPIDIDDVVAYLAAAPRRRGVGRARGPDRLPRRAAPTARCSTAWRVALGKRPRPKLPVPLLTPWLSSLWIGLVTPVDARVARPLIEGLSTETVVTDPSGAALFDVEPIGFDASLRKAVAAERGAARPRPHRRRDARRRDGSRWTHRAAAASSCRAMLGRLAAVRWPCSPPASRSRARPPAARRAARGAREGAAPGRVKQNGLHEVGTSNCGPQIDRWERDMGLKVPPCRVWCGAFVHQAFLRPACSSPRG